MSGSRTIIKFLGIVAATAALSSLVQRWSNLGLYEFCAEIISYYRSLTSQIKYIALDWWWPFEIAIPLWLIDVLTLWLLIGYSLLRGSRETVSGKMTTARRSAQRDAISRQMSDKPIYKRAFALLAFRMSIVKSVWKAWIISPYILIFGFINDTIKLIRPPYFIPRRNSTPIFYLRRKLVIYTKIYSAVFAPLLGAIIFFAINGIALNPG